MEMDEKTVWRAILVVAGALAETVDRFAHQPTSERLQAMLAALIKFDLAAVEAARYLLDESEKLRSGFGQSGAPS